MAEFVIDLLKFLGWQFIGFGLLFFIFYKIIGYSSIWNTENDRKRWIDALDQDSWKLRYHDAMFDILAWFDRQLSPNELASGASPARISFSHGLISLSMLVAVAYPVISFIGQWVFGSPLQLGSNQIAPAGTDVARIFITFWLLSPLFLYLFSAKSKSRWRFPSFILATVILYGGIFLSDRFGVPNAVTGAVAVAVAFAVAGAVAVAVAVALLLIEPKFGPHPIFRVLYLCIFLVTISVIICMQPELRDGRNIPAAYTILFFAIFPIFNAIADFASTGFTRLFLRRGLAGTTPLNAVFDTLVGIAIFFLLGGFLITYIHYIRPQNGIALLDLSVLFQQLNDLSNFWWLGLMLGSTLLPTFLHLVIGIGTIALQYPEPVRQWIIEKLQSGGQGSVIHGRTASIAICTLVTLSWWLPIIGFYYLATLNHNALIRSVVSIFRWWAQTIGAI